MMNESENHWNENSTTMYLEIANIAVPARAEQIATFLTLIPFQRDESFRVVELASGEGFLAAAILRAYPAATILALDVSGLMLETTAKRLSSFARRFEIGEFDMLKTDWFNMMNATDVVVSSLCIHHLNANQKQRLFSATAERLSQNGTLLIADIISAQNDAANHLHATNWDCTTRLQSDDEAHYQHFVDTKWNIFLHPDPMDKPSPLFTQLLWMQAAGFEAVDCFWMRAGHAIYGGYKSANGTHSDLMFAEAMQFAEAALKS